MQWRRGLIQVLHKFINAIFVEKVMYFVATLIHQIYFDAFI
jgi:hypothetical protein